MTATAWTASDLMESFTDATVGENTAIIHNGESMGRAVLLGRVRAAARQLHPATGVVGVYSARSPNTVVGMLGVLAAGRTYCPIDPRFPAEHRDRLIAAAGCDTIVITEAGQQVPPGMRVVDLTRPAAHSQPLNVSDGQPAYVLFTSGSTGAPKPVVTSRRAISTVIAALRELFELKPSDRVLQFAALSWDTCFEEILPTLTANATVVFDDDAHSASFPRFLRMLDNRQISVVNVPTAFWHELVRFLDEADTRLPDCLRLVVIGGEAVDPARLAQWHSLGTSGIRLLNTYGCTETTLITHAAELTSPSDPVPIGVPLPHVAEHIGDDGELLIGGPSVAEGYLNLPEATAQKFVDLPQGRFFHTGDRVEHCPDGLVHAGRLDDEVKIRGVRVNPAEVENHLTALPQVAAAAVAGARVAGRTTLVAYVVAADKAETVKLSSEVISLLRTRAPAHLIPSRVTVVPKLVHTASQKIDRAATHRHYAPDRAGRGSNDR